MNYPKEMELHDILQNLANDWDSFLVKATTSDFLLSEIYQLYALVDSLNNEIH